MSDLQNQWAFNEENQRNIKTSNRLGTWNYIYGAISYNVDVFNGSPFLPIAPSKHQWKLNVLIL